MSAHAKVFALACIDPRFRHATATFIEKKFGLKPTEYDLKTDAGGIKEIALQTLSRFCNKAETQCGHPVPMAFF